MSSARWPEHGGSPLLAAAPGLAPAPDSLPFIRPSLGAPSAHLLPCAGCGALNGRSALACWSCEADLLALASFAPFVPPVPAMAAVEPLVEHVVEHVVEPEPAAPGASAEAADGRRGLHLVSRGGAPASVQPAPTLAAPELTPDLPVLTTVVEPAVLVPPERNDSHHERPMLARALALAAIVVLAVVGWVRWPAPPPGPVASMASAPAVSRVDAAVERPFSAPAQDAEPDRASLSFPPVEGAPEAAAADPPAPSAAPSRAAPPAPVVSAAHRPVPKPREIRETVSPPPAACTSNMAALGFCTLPPAAAKE